MILRVLSQQYAQNLAYARRLVEGLGDEESVLQPAEGMNHPRWVIGHLAAAADRVTGHWSLGLALTLDEAYFKTYGAGSAPLADVAAYRPLDELIELLGQRHQAVSEALEGADASLFERSASSDVPQGFRERFPTVGHALVYTMTCHEQMHLGQVSAWRRVRGLPAV